MDQLVSVLPAWLAASAVQYTYTALFIGSFLEGPIVMMTGGFLLRIGQVSFLPLYIALVLGDFISDIAWYLAGYAVARNVLLRWGRLFGITPEGIEQMEPIFKHYSLRILIVSKLTMGFGLAAATLTTAGMLRVSFVRYAIVNLVCGLAWSLVMLLIGYFFGNLFDLIPGGFKIPFIVIMFIVWIAWLHYAARKAHGIEMNVPHGGK